MDSILNPSHVGLSGLGVTKRGQVVPRMAKNIRGDLKCETPIFPYTLKNLLTH